MIKRENYTFVRAKCKTKRIIETIAMLNRKPMGRYFFNDYMLERMNNSIKYIIRV